MQTLHISPSSLRGRVAVPPSKSHTLRAILFGSMAKGITRVYSFLPSPDTDSMIEACRCLGAFIEKRGDYLEIIGVEGKPKKVSSVINVGNSGQVLRFIGALSGLIGEKTIFTGDLSIQKNRPVEALIEGLRQLGAKCLFLEKENHPPFSVEGPICPGVITIDGEDSQPVSGLLIAASFLKGTTEVRVNNPGERPWVRLTVDWLRKLGVSIHNEEEKRFIVEGREIEGFNYRVCGDFSSAAFPIASSLVTSSSLTVENLDFSDGQGDKKVIEILQNMGATIFVDKEKKQLQVKKGSSLKGRKIDVNDCIDALPVLAVLGCFAEGTTEIVGGKIARKKESDRIFAIHQELKKMGAQIEEREEGVIVHKSVLQGAVVKSHFDHRIAMALAVAALGCQGETVIENIECIEKSYPYFVEDLKKVGAKWRRS